MTMGSCHRWPRDIAARLLKWVDYGPRGARQQTARSIVHLFGLTGGIASGKSTVASRLRAKGVPIIDADALAREVVAPGTDGLRAIADTFGTSVLSPDGSLDRTPLAPG